MKLVFASDSLKGTLTSAQANALLETAAREALPAAVCVSFPMADGGEGTLDAVRGARTGEGVSLYVHDGLFRRTRSEVFISGEEGFVETAATCGLAKLGAAKRDPLRATSYGVGECMSHAVYHGCTQVYVGLGGSCTNDGGMGCLRALGVRFFDACGNELAGCGADLLKVARIDEDGLLPKVRDAAFTALCDVTNPLLGQNGATNVFGRQKGADGDALERLEAGMRNFADVIARTHPGVDFDTPGFGAAGGLGMALSVFLGAQVSSGIETLLQWTGIDAALAGADLVVTGEGRLDGQSAQGKVVSGIVAHARRERVPVAVVCGTSALDERTWRELGIDYVVEAGTDPEAPIDLSHTRESYLQAARRLFAAIASSR